LVELFKEAAREEVERDGLLAYTIMPPSGDDGLDILCMLRFADRKSFETRIRPECLDGATQFCDASYEGAGLMEFEKALHFER
jgi:hypothetical protein